MKKTVKKILLSSIFEALGMTALSAAWAFCRGVIYVWWAYPIELAIFLVGFMFFNIGFEIQFKK